MEEEGLELLIKIKKTNNDKLIADKMAWTFANSHQEVVNSEVKIEDLRNAWPALLQ